MQPLEPTIDPAAGGATGGSTPAVGVTDGEVDLFAFALLLRSHLLRIVLCSLLAAILAVIFVLTVTPLFSSSVSLLVPQPKAAGAQLLDAAGGLDILGGGVTVVYLDLLKSRAIGDQIIRQNDLMRHYKSRTLPEAESTLASLTAMTGGKEGLIVITVQDHDAKLAAEIANGYAAALDQMNQRLAITSASLQRKYYERELVDEKNALADAEVALKQTEERTGVIEPQLQTQGTLQATDRTQAELRAKQVELGALLQSETQQNPEVVRLKAEIGGLESQLRAMQSGGGSATPLAAKKVPGEVLDNIRAMREVKFHESLMELLSREYEAAKQEEAKNFTLIQVLDPAIPALHKSWPPRTLYCIFAGFLGAVLGVLYTLGEAFVEKVLRNPANRERYHALRSGDADASQTQRP